MRSIGSTSPNPRRRRAGTKSASPTEERPWLVLSSGLDSFQSRPRRAPGRRREAARAARARGRAELSRRRSAGSPAKDKARRRSRSPTSAVGSTKQQTWLLLRRLRAVPRGRAAGVLAAARTRVGASVPGRTRHIRSRACGNGLATGILFDAFADEDFVRALLAALSERASVRVGSGTLRFTPTNALGALLPKRLAQAPISHTAESSNLTLRHRRATVPESVSALARRRAPRVGARPLPDGALAVRRRATDGRRHRPRAAVGRADDDRPRASGRTEPGRRLEIHPALSRAQPRRRRWRARRTARSARPITRATCCSSARLPRARPSCTVR